MLVSRCHLLFLHISKFKEQIKNRKHMAKQTKIETSKEVYYSTGKQKNSDVAMDDR